MNLLTLLISAGLIAAGVIVGVCIELAIDAKTIRDLQDENRKLELENEQLRQENNCEVIEIVTRPEWADDIEFGDF